MKDKHGVQRGRCGIPNCECEQYRPPPLDSVGGKLYCEYCNHLPGKHLRIIALGACSGCEKDNCSKYEPADEWSYSECQYCGCDAKDHEGAENLTPVRPLGASPRVKVDPGRTSVQTFVHGSCKCQGCPYGRRLDPTTGHVLDYCSKTCAAKDIASQSAASSSSSVAVSGAPSAAGLMDPALIKQFLQTPVGAKLLTATMQGSHPQSKPNLLPLTINPPSLTSTIPPVMQPPAAVPICSKCNASPANPGHKWCQKCFLGNPVTTATTSSAVPSST